MPFIKLNTNVKIENADVLQHKMAELITLIPGKTPAVTNVLLADEQKLYFSGSGEPCAMIETEVSAGTDQSNIRVYAYAMIELVSRELGIPEKKVHVNVIAMDNWIVKKEG